MKIFVTGATGFTGSFLTEQLLEAGHDVVGLDNQRGYRFDELKSKGAELHVGSVTDKELVDQLTQGCDRVYHLAAAFRKVNLPRQVYWDVNVEGTRNVLEAAKKYNVPRVLYCSTCGVHGNVENPPADESSPIAPADWYQETKWEGEKVCHEFLKDRACGSPSFVQPLSSVRAIPKGSSCFTKELPKEDSSWLATAGHIIIPVTSSI